MKIIKKITAVLLSAAIAFSVSLQASAEADTAAGEPYSVQAHIGDRLLGTAHDLIFGLLMRLTRQKDIPSYEEYLKDKNENFFEGTDGRVTGSGWSGGFAKGSVIPEKWRCGTDGKSNPEGSCLKIPRATGGYQFTASKLYTDQMMNMVILSCGSDENRNGIDDIVIFISVDGIGITAGTCDRIRESVRKALKPCGVTDGDILACNVSATHCHAGLDIQGMFIFTLFKNKLNILSDYDRSLNEEMENSICSRASHCAAEAYEKMEKGSMSFFETDEIGGCSDKLEFGAKTKNSFSCFFFEGESGEKTLISNIGAHPTTFSAQGTKMVCTDYPYFLALALSDAGYNLVFTQSGQAAVSSPGEPNNVSEARNAEADEWVKSRAYSKDEWIKLFGKSYTENKYDTVEEKIEGLMRKGYLLAHFIIDSADKAVNIEPSLNIKNSQTLLSLENGIMAWGSVSGLLGEHVVTSPDAETGYGVVVETDYLEFGDAVVILTAPGELSPSLVFGTDPDYDGDILWTGKTSWTGESWKYDSIEKTVCGRAENEGKKFILMGITNDALGYMFPDICAPESLLGTLLFYKENSDDMTNCMLMTIGTCCGSELMEAYTALVESVSSR